MVPAITLIEHHSQNDALPISSRTFAQTGASLDGVLLADSPSQRSGSIERPSTARWADRKSTRLNSSHVANSYAVFFLIKKKRRKDHININPYKQVIP